VRSALVLSLSCCCGVSGHAKKLPKTVNLNEVSLRIPGLKKGVTLWKGGKIRNLLNGNDSPFNSSVRKENRTVESG